MQSSGGSLVQQTTQPKLSLSVDSNGKENAVVDKSSDVFLKAKAEARAELI